MTDEREGRPSASSIGAMALCPGRHNAGILYPAPERDGEDAEIGTQIHQALESGDLIGMAEDEAEAAIRLDAIENKIVQKWIADKGIMDVPHRTREKRLWITRGVERVCSGKPDVVAMAGKHALVIDYKTGWAAQPTPDQHEQLRTLAVAVEENHNVDDVRVQVASLHESNRTACDYTTLDIERSRGWLFDILDRSADENAPRIPGELQCKYCPAKANCPEAKAIMLTLPGERPVRWLDLSAERKLALWQASKVATLVAQHIQDAVSIELEADPTSIPGMQIGKPSEVTSITNLRGFLTEVQNGTLRGLYPQELIDAGLVKITKANAVEVRRRLTDCTEKAAEDWIKSLPNGEGGIVTRSKKRGRISVAQQKAIKQ